MKTIETTHNRSKLGARCALLVAGTWTLASAGCAVSSGEELAETDRGERNEAVYGGTTVSFSDLENYNNAIVELGGGTGILIAPRLVLTAQHCNGSCEWGAPNKPAKVRIGNDSRYARRLESVAVSESYDYGADPDLVSSCSKSDSKDIGIWVLDHPVANALPYWRPSSDLTSGTSHLYGFGTEYTGRPDIDVDWQGQLYSPNKTSVEFGPYTLGDGTLTADVMSSNDGVTLTVWRRWTDDGEAHEKKLCSKSPSDGPCRVTGPTDRGDTIYVELAGKADGVTRWGRLTIDYTNPYGGTSGLLRTTTCSSTKEFNHGKELSYNCAGSDRSEGGDSGGPLFNDNGEQVGVNTEHNGKMSYGVAIGAKKGWIEDQIDRFRAKLLTGDFDGDGRGDLYFASKSASWFDLSSKTTAPGNVGVPDGDVDGTGPGCFGTALVGNFFGAASGKDDVACALPIPTLGNLLSYDSSDVDGLGEFDSAELLRSPWCNGEIHVGDFDGDGMDDVFCREAGSRWVDVNDRTDKPFGEKDYVFPNAWCGPTDESEILVGDYNADGKDDLLCWQKTPGSRAYYVKYARITHDSVNGILIPKQSFSAHQKLDTAWCETGRIYVGDANRDGADDLICHGDHNDSLWVDLADPSGSFPFEGKHNWQTYGFSWCNGKEFSVDDMNGDGYDDLVCHRSRSGQVWMINNTTSTTNLYPWTGKSDARIPDRQDRTLR